MRSRFAPHRLTVAVVAGGLLLPLDAVAGDTMDGYRSAQFGMSADEVRSVVEDDGVIITTTEETADGDKLLDGYVDDDTEAGIRYVFPEGRDQLALVVKFHPDHDDPGPLVERLQADHGEPWEDDMAEQWFEQLRDDMPEGVRNLTVWGGDEGARERFIRLWVFEDYLSVEYLDINLLRGG